MLKKMLQAKLHGVHVTSCCLEYEGSCGVDRTLLDACGMIANQYVEVYNVTNGHRFSTYLISLPAECGEITLNGAAARQAAVLDKLIVCTYSLYDLHDLKDYRPTVVIVDPRNRLVQR
jgi:aspartate 1-decarboxylase